MTRDVSTGTDTASQEAIVRPVLFAELMYDSAPVRVHSWIGDLSFNSAGDSVSYTFEGVGVLGSVSAVGETAELTAIGASLTFSGIPSEFISYAFENAQGRQGTIWLGFLDSNYALVDDPSIIYRGFIDNAEIKWGKTGTVTVHLENRMLEWNVPDNRRYTDAVQQNEYDGDKFFEFLPKMLNKELLWGVPTDNMPPSPNIINAQRGLGESQGPGAPIETTPLIPGLPENHPLNLAKQGGSGPGAGTGGNAPIPDVLKKSRD